MRRSNWTFIAVVCLWWHTIIMAQPVCHIIQYDEEDGVPSSHITQLLQDGNGFMWFATWNGLCRFDGYEFKTFKPQVGDGCHMTTDRIRNITLLPTGNILCQVDDDYFLFDKTTYLFRDLTEEEKTKATEEEWNHRQSRSLLKGKNYTWTDCHQTRWTLEGDGRLSYIDPKTDQPITYPLSLSFRTLTFALADQRGHLWALDYGSIYYFCTDVQRTSRIDIQPRAEVKCLFNDCQGRYWVTTKDDKVVRVYQQQDDHLIGYLGKDGHLYPNYTTFGSPIYCMLQSADGTLWLGSKEDGLFRMRAKGNDFEISHLTEMPYHDVYHLKEDQMGRLWVAALDGGLCYTDQPQADQPIFHIPVHYPKEQCPRARYIHITHNGILLTATSSGLLVARLKHDADNMQFKLHRREPNMRQSLSCSATMDIAQDDQGHFLVSTESGGVNQIMTEDLLDDTLLFRHIRNQFHVQSNDIVLSLTPVQKNKMMAVGSHLITLIDSTVHGRVLDICNFNADYRFSEAHPIPLSNGRWLFGLMDGASIITEEQLSRQAYHPRLAFTALTIRGGNNNWAVENLDSLTLQPDERSITLHFAALDYEAPERINYTFRLLTDSQDDSTPWNYIGHDRSATLLDLEPGSYVLEIRSTNADGEWLTNTRMLTLIVRPTFWESTLGQIVLIIFFVAFLIAVIYTLLYIRRIKRKQRETLQKYLTLIEVREQKEEARNKMSDISSYTSDTKPQNSELDPMLQRVMTYVNENISNSDANVGDMASAAATSRSGLQRKLKQTMGITPQDLLREARIKRACQLLRHTDKAVSEIAYTCGFSDPKYFSRSFKQSTGMSPSDYKNAS
ncbi:MAG: helix-turn-helix domain-containing protein [Prevotella sp.]|nr:helix-turn-helix domain-containing protein [Prevotella sp.]